MSGSEEDKRDPEKKKGGGESVRKGREKEKSQKTAMTMKRYCRKTNDIFLGSFHGFPSPCLLFRIKKKKIIFHLGTSCDIEHKHPFIRIISVTQEIGDNALIKNYILVNVK